MKSVISVILANLIAASLAGNAFAAEEQLPLNSDSAALVENVENGDFQAEAEYTVNTNNDITTDDVSVNVEVTVTPEEGTELSNASVTAAADTSSWYYNNESGAMRNVYTVDPNHDTDASSIDIVAGGTVSLTGADAENAETKLEVSFDDSRYDGTTQDVVFKTYGNGELDDEYRYLDDEDIDTSVEGKVTVRTVFQGIRNWILGLVDKDVDARLYVFRGTDSAQTTGTEIINEGTEAEAVLEVESHYRWWGDYYLDHTNKYDRTNNKVYVDDSVYSSDDKFNMAYQKREGNGFDIIGRLEGDWKQVTFAHCGYYTDINVSSGSYDNLNVDVNPTIVGSSGQLIRAVYTVTNTGTEPIVFSMGSHCDVQIGSDDYAPIIPLEMGGQHIGFNMQSTQSNDVTSNGTPATLAFVCSGDNGYITPVDSLWYGYYYERWDNIYTGAIQNDIVSGLDSGMSYSWMNREIPAGATQTYAVLFGIGDIEAISKEVEEIKNELPPEKKPEKTPEIAVYSAPRIEDFINVVQGGDNNNPGANPSGNNGPDAEIKFRTQLEGGDVIIDAIDKEGNNVDPDEFTLTSLEQLTGFGAKKADLGFGNRLTVKVDLESVKSLGYSDIVVVHKDNRIVSINNGDKELMSIDSGALLDDTPGHVTVDFTTGKVVIFYDGEQIFELELTGAENEHYNVKLENGFLEVFDDAGNLLAKVAKDIQK